MLLILALCRPIVFRQSEDLLVIFLVDVSESVDLDSARDAAIDIAQADGTLGPQHSCTLVTIGNGEVIRMRVTMAANKIRRVPEGLAALPSLALTELRKEVSPVQTRIRSLLGST